MYLWHWTVKEQVTNLCNQTIYLAREQKILNNHVSKVQRHPSLQQKRLEPKKQVNTPQKLILPETQFKMQTEHKSVDKGGSSLDKKKFPTAMVTS